MFTFCLFSFLWYCFATFIYHQLLTFYWPLAKPVHPLQAVFMCLCILSRCQLWLTWRCKHPYRWVWNDFLSKLLFYFNHPLWFSSKSKINIHQQPSSFHIVSIYLYKIHPHILNISQPSSGLSSVLHSAQIQCFSLPTSCFCWWELSGFNTPEDTY